MLVRRLLGSFPLPPSGGVLILAGICAALLCCILRWTAHTRGGAEIFPQATWAVSGILSLASLALMLAVTVPPIPTAPLIIGWSCVVAAEASWWTVTILRGAPPSLRSIVQQFASVDVPRMAPDEAPDVASQASCASDANLGPSTDETADETLPAQVTQRVSRMRTDDGAEIIAGSLRATFGPGERTQVLHVSFCPPMDAVPEWCAEITDGPAADVEVVQLAPYGVRLEIKLAAPATEIVSLVLQFEAIGARPGNPG
jgi:hypothetical protein